MHLVKFRHKGLRLLYTEGNPKGVSPAFVDKLNKILLSLETAQTLDQVGRFPGWKLHALKGDLNGYWSVTVTGNWRVIFRYDDLDKNVSDIDLTDYH